MGQEASQRVKKLQSDVSSSEVHERGEDLGNNSDQSTSSENSIKRRGRNESENEFHDESPKNEFRDASDPKGTRRVPSG